MFGEVLPIDLQLYGLDAFAPMHISSDTGMRFLWCLVVDQSDQKIGCCLAHTAVGQLDRGQCGFQHLANQAMIVVASNRYVARHFQSA